MNLRERVQADRTGPLRFAGALGHTVMLVVTYEDGNRSIALHTCDKANALLAARTEHIGREPIVYERTKRGWKRVTQ